MKKDKRYYIASCSFGKDSLAMVLRLIEEDMPLDEIVFYDTGMEFQAIYNVREKLLPLLTEKGIKYTELKPQREFIYDMLEKPIKDHYGYGWCGGCRRWGTTFKNSVIDSYKTQYKNITEYIGIAYDEQDRVKEKSYPLVEWKMTETDCLKYCYDRGFCWDEDGVELYTVLDRVSCWCCANKNAWELYNIWKYLPKYWDKLKALQSRIEMPMKRLCNKKFGQYGNVFQLEKVFESGYVPKHRKKRKDDANGRSPMDKTLHRHVRQAED